MSPSGESVPATLSLFDFPKTEAVVTVAHDDTGHRARRALKAGGILFGLACLSVFIPIAHFVLVPGFLLAAIVVGARRFAQSSRVERVHGRCPRCSTEQDFILDRTPLEGDLELTCVSCRNQVRGRTARAETA